MKLKEIIDSYESLEKFSKLNHSCLELDFTTIKKIMNIVKRANEEMAIFEKIQRELVMKYGKEDKKNRGRFTVAHADKEKQQKFNEEYKKIRETEIDYKIEKVKLKFDYKKLDLNTSDLINLELYFDLN